VDTKAPDALRRLKKAIAIKPPDVTQQETPYEGGLGFCVDLEKKDFGRQESVGQSQEGRLEGVDSAPFVLDGTEFTQIYGGEAI